MSMLEEDKQQKKLTFSELASRYLEDYCKTRIKLNTITNYKTLLKVILEEFGEQYCENISPYSLEHFYNSLRNKKLSENTVQHYYNLINAIFERGIKWELINKNPNSKIDKPKIVKKEAKIYNEKQIKELFKALDNEPIYYQAPIILCLESGMRREELNGLKWENINFEKKEIIIEEVRIATGKKIVIETPKTIKSKRTIKISDYSINYLKQLKEYQNNCAMLLKNKWENSGYVFVNDKGNPLYPDTLSKMFKKIQKKYGLEPLSLHQLRHTSASLLVSNGEDIASISARLGHSNISTTLNMYTHPLDSAQIKTANSMNNILNTIAST